MAAISNLYVNLITRTAAFEKGMARGKRSLRSFSKRVAAVQKRLADMGRRMTTMVTLPILAVGTLATKSFASFDDAMTKSLAIMKDITPEMRKEMERVALAISKEGVKSATDLAKSYFYLASAGLSAKQSIAALPAVEKFAVAGAFDMSTATTLAADAQSALGLKVKNAAKNLENLTRVTDVLVGANTLANATTEQFSQALTSDAGPAMKLFEIELEEGVAVLAAYADQGIKAEEAGNMFGRMLRLMTKGFRENEKAWQEFGVNIYDATGKLRPMYEIVEGLSLRLEKLSTKQKVAQFEMLGFAARSSKAIAPLLGMQDAIKDYNKALVEMKGITQETYEKQLKSFSAQMKILKNRIVAVGIEIGSFLAPSILKLNMTIRKIVEEWGKLNDSVKKYILLLGGIAAAIGPALLMSALLVKVFRLMIFGIKPVIAAFALLAKAMFSPLGVALLFVAMAYTLRVAWLQNLTTIKDRMQEWFDAFKQGFDWLAKGPVGKFLKWFAAGWYDVFKLLTTQFDDFLADLAGGFAGIVAWIKKVKENFVNIWTDPWVDISEFRKTFKGGLEAFSVGFVEGRGKAEKALESFTNSVIAGYKTTTLYLKAFGEATTEHLSSLMEAIKIQFGQDADAIINLIKNKIALFQKITKETGIDLSEIEKVEKAIKRLIGEIGTGISKKLMIDAGKFKVFRPAFVSLAGLAMGGERTPRLKFERLNYEQQRQLNKEVYEQTKILNRIEFNTKRTANASKEELN